MKKVRSPKNIRLKTGRSATRSNRPVLGKLNRPVSVRKLKDNVLDNNFILDYIKLT